MAEKKKKSFPERYPRLRCENGHYGFNEDAICPICHSEIRIYPGLGLNLDEEVRIMTDFGLIRCTSGHFYNSNSTKCPRCNPEPPRSSTETLPVMAASVPPAVDALAPIPTPEDPVPKDEAELLASGGFKVWVSEENLGLTMPTPSSGSTLPGPSRHSDSPTGYGRWIWYPADGKENSWAPLIMPERVYFPSSPSDECRSLATSPRSPSHSPPGPERSSPAPPEREEEDDGTANGDDGEGKY